MQQIRLTNNNQWGIFRPYAKWPITWIYYRNARKHLQNLTAPLLCIGVDANIQVPVIIVIIIFIVIVLGVNMTSQSVNPRSIFSERHWREGRKQEGNVEFAGSCLQLTDSVIPKFATERDPATHLKRWHRLVLRMSEQLHKICMACHKVAQPGKVGLCRIRVAFCSCLRDRNANDAQCLVSCPYNTL